MLSYNTMHCLICKKTFDDRKDLNYTCRCSEGHAVCFGCSENKRYADIQDLFGYSHRLCVKTYHEDDLAAWHQEARERAEKDLKFKEEYILPNLDTSHRLNIEEIFKTYKGVKHVTGAIGEEYDYTYLPEEVDDRWETATQPARKHDVIHQILVPEDTTLTMVSNNKEIMRAELKENEPFTLNLPIRWCLYSMISFKFEPVIDRRVFIHIHKYMGRLWGGRSSCVPYVEKPCCSQQRIWRGSRKVGKNTRE
jgi:hypothetical protein